MKGRPWESSTRLLVVRLVIAPYTSGVFQGGRAFLSPWVTCIARRSGLVASMAQHNTGLPLPCTPSWILTQARAICAG